MNYVVTIKRQLTDEESAEAEAQALKKIDGAYSQLMNELGCDRSNPDESAAMRKLSLAFAKVMNDA